MFCTVFPSTVGTLDNDGLTIVFVNKKGVSTLGANSNVHAVNYEFNPTLVSWVKITNFIFYDIIMLIINRFHLQILLKQFLFHSFYLCKILGGKAMQQKYT